MFTHRVPIKIIGFSLKNEKFIANPQNTSIKNTSNEPINVIIVIFSISIMFLSNEILAFFRYEMVIGDKIEKIAIKNVILLRIENGK